MGTQILLPEYTRDFLSYLIILSAVPANFLAPVPGDLVCLCVSSSSHFKSSIESVSESEMQPDKSTNLIGVRSFQRDIYKLSSPSGLVVKVSD